MCCYKMVKTKFSPKAIWPRATVLSYPNAAFIYLFCYEPFPYLSSASLIWHLISLGLELLITWFFCAYLHNMAVRGQWLYTNKPHPAASSAVLWTYRRDTAGEGGLKSPFWTGFSPWLPISINSTLCWVNVSNEVIYLYIFSWCNYQKVWLKRTQWGR